MLGSLIIYLKGMRRMMFQLSGFYYRCRIIRGTQKGTRILTTTHIWGLGASASGTSDFGLRVLGLRSWV